ncbi:MAG: PH domain-containing protein [Candidatus Micrarchaeota archaeon]
MEHEQKHQKIYRPFALIPSLKVFLACLFMTGILLYFVNTTNDFFVPILLVIWGLGAISVAYIFIQDHCHTILLTEGGIKACKGIFMKKETLVPTSKITESSFTQSIFERLFSYGTVRIDTPGGADVAIEMKNMRITDIKEILAFVDKKDG